MASRQVDVSEDGAELVISFPYDRRLVDVARALPGRRFDGLTKRWRCPADHAREVVDLLVVEGFAITAAARALYLKQGGTALTDEAGSNGGGENAGSAAVGEEGALFAKIVAKAKERDAAAGDGSAASTTDPSKATSASTAAASLTVSELNARAKRALLRAFPETIWVVGEIAGFDRNRHRAHVHFELVEKAAETPGSPGSAGSDRGAIKASVSAVLFERTRREVERTLAKADAPFELKDGIEVRLEVRVDLYETRGSFQLVVESIDPIHTLGKLAQNRAAVLAELDKLGLREKNRSLPWPEVPLRVGLITSRGSDAYNDFVNELGRSGFAFELTVIDARMQGERLEAGLVGAIEWFGARAADFDLLAIVRGGGARTDLLWFDNLRVALAVARCPIKVVSGIGHQRDVSVVDLIAHPEKTPTAAAAVIVARVQEFAVHLEESFKHLADRVARALEEEGERLLACGDDLQRLARGATRVERTRLIAALRRLAPATRGRLREGRASLGDARVRLLSFARARTRLAQAALVTVKARLAPERFAAWFKRRGASLAELDRLAQSLHPKAVLRRGFAVVRDERGKTLRDAKCVKPGAPIEATLARGRLRARVERSEEEPEEGGRSG
jgi:exodeoxyribonuclease VII large subunit